MSLPIKWNVAILVLVTSHFKYAFLKLSKYYDIITDDSRINRLRNNAGYPIETSDE